MLAQAQASLSPAGGSSAVRIAVRTFSMTIFAMGCPNSSASKSKRSASSLLCTSPGRHAHKDAQLPAKKRSTAGQRAARALHVPPRACGGGVAPREEGESVSRIAAAAGGRACATHTVRRTKHLRADGSSTFSRDDARGALHFTQMDDVRSRSIRTVPRSACIFMSRIFSFCSAFAQPASAAWKWRSASE